MCQYVLSSGKDSMVRLWELSTCRSLITYTGAGVTGRQEHRTQAIFNHTEDYGTVLLNQFQLLEFSAFNLLLNVLLIGCTFLPLLFLHLHLPPPYPLTSTWPHLNSDVCLEEGEY